MSRINQFSIGQKATLRKTITKIDIDRFVELTGDDNPLHTVEAFAKESGFKEVVVHGMLGASFISTLVGKHLPGSGALWVSNKIDFHAPARVNDELLIEAEVTAVHVNQSLLTIQVQITNQYNQKLTTAECKVKVLDTVEKKPETKQVKTAPVVIITGGSSGIGAATAILAAEKGFKVVVNFLKNERGAQEVVSRIKESGGEALAVRADVSQPAEAKRLVDTALAHFGGIDGLVNGAAPRIVEKKLELTQWDDIELQINGQVKAAFLCIKEALPSLQKSGRGSIVNIGSVVADLSPPPSWLGYNLAKHGLHALTRCLTEPLGLQKVRINTVAPGMTDTPFIVAIPEKARLLAEMQTPLKKIATPRDIAEVIVFALADGAQHITGETFRVNGGKTLL